VCFPFFLSRGDEAPAPAGLADNDQTLPFLVRWPFFFLRLRNHKVCLPPGRGPDPASRPGDHQNFFQAASFSLFPRKKLVGCGRYFPGNKGGRLAPFPPWADLFSSSRLHPPLPFPCKGGALVVGTEWPSSFPSLKWSPFFSKGVPPGALEVPHGKTAPSATSSS